ncbi:MAG: hypothetical protein ACK5XJ_07635 [Burkholderiales bacterium]
MPDKIDTNRSNILQAPSESDRVKSPTWDRTMHQLAPALHQIRQLIEDIELL